MREDQIASTGVDVEALPEIPFGHRRALDVPAWPAGTPRALPSRFPGFRRFPHCEIECIPLPSTSLDSVALPQIIEIVTRKLPIRRKRPDGEVDIAVGLVCVATCDEGLNIGDHLWDVLGRFRLSGRSQVAELVVGLSEGTEREDRDLLGRHVKFSRPDDDLVVDIRDIANELNIVSEPSEVPPKNIERHRAASMPEMRFGLHRGTTHVDRHNPVFPRNERHHSALKGVVDLHRMHGTRGYIGIRTQG
jgi:hypothetical protein